MFHLILGCNIKQLSAKDITCYVSYNFVMLLLCTVSFNMKSSLYVLILFDPIS